MEHASGSYNISLVALSVIIAIVASYASLDLASRAGRNREPSSGGRRTAQLSGSAFAMGLGIWTMHFVGMLALRLPFPAVYHVGLTLLSLLIAIGSSFLAIFLVSRHRLSANRFIVSGMFMGGGISSMHYVGMAAIQSAFVIHYRPLPFFASIAIAVTVSYAALYTTFRLQNGNDLGHRKRRLVPGAVLFGVAVTGMHYMGMTASHFMSPPSAARTDAFAKTWAFLNATVDPGVLSVWVGITIGILIAILIGGAFIDRRLAMESARMSGLQFEALFDGNPDLVCVFDLNGHIIGVNRASEPVMGYKADELLHRSKRLFIVPDRVEAADRLFEEVKSGQARQYEMSVIHKSGHPVDLNVTAIPVRDGDDVLAVVTIAKDVTEQKRAEEQYRRSDKLNVAGQLAAGVAHEIRNPLTSIKGFLHLMRTGGDRKELYDIVQSEVEQIDRIITEFLLLAKQQPAQYRRTNLADLLDNVLALLNAQAHMNNIEIVASFEPDIPDIWCDDDQIRQVFVNLLKNAIESMTEKGMIVLELRKKGDKEVLIRIVDEGIGISEELKTRLGEPFYSTKEKGTGLGLMVTFKIIQEHKGTIRYQNGNVRGTAVEVTLPVE
ncbi:MHYT domain-containing protein [Paenibacillus flagellatus]|nr:MHYT domain-containing protein [Paenibacillus flagellatus]